MIHGWLWRHLPGPSWLRVVILVLAAFGVAVLCFTTVYPAIAPLMPRNDTTVGKAPGVGSSPSTTTTRPSKSIFGYLEQLRGDSF